MNYTIFKIIKVKFSGEEKVVLSTNDKNYAEEALSTYSRQSADDELFTMVED